jgi:hypothetical protein
MKAVFLIFAAGCLAPPIEKPPVNTVEDHRFNVTLTAHQKVDLLFMIDNSNSMAPKQALLKQRFPGFIQQLRDFAARGLPAWYHLGVVTSDLGAGNGCITNDGGRLNTVDRTDSKNPKSCGLGGGLSFIDFNQLAGSANVPDVEAAFQCIASVGDIGCGFEHQLESVYHALTAGVPENQGFLRDDAVLAVVFLTDEDDCSAPPDTDLFDQTKSGTDYSQPGNYGPWNSFRCTQFGIVNNGEPLPWPATGDYGGPGPAPFSELPGLGKLFDVARYQQIFTKDKSGGGIKDDPGHELMLISIAAPSTPFRTVLSNPNVVARDACSPYNGTSCTVTLDHSCYAAADHDLAGDPAVRLHAVVSAATNHDESTSICDAGYDQALQKLSDFIGKSFHGDCITAPIDHPDMPDCVVRETIGSDSSLLPWCGSASSAHPCWQLVSRPDCSAVLDPSDGSLQQLGFEVVRDQEPSGTIVDDVSCAIVAASMK